MTVQTELRRVVQTGNGATATFYFNAPVLGLDDLDIYTVTTAGVQTLQTRGGAGTFDYTMTINSSTKYATVTLNNNLTNGFKVVMLRSTAITQGVDYVEGDPFLAETHEGALDRLTIIATQLQEQLDRSVKVVETSATTGIKIEELEADKILVVNSAADGLTMGPTLAEVDTVADSIADVQTVAASIASVNTVASDLNEAVSEINTVAVNITNVNSVGTYISNVNTVATDIAAINTNATNIVAIQNASTNATNAANSATTAEAARDATLAAYDSFDDRYLGAKSSNPTLDNDGNALLAGSLYYNTTVPEMRLYTGSAWVAAYVSGAAYLASANNLSDVANTATARTNLGVAIGTNVQAYNANTAFTNVNQSFSVAQRGTITALTDGSTITPNMNNANNFSVTLGGNRTLANPTNLTAGQSGVIVVTQDGTGSRTLAYGSNWKFPGGTAPTLTTTAAAVDVIAYYVESASRITARLVADVK